MSDGNFEGNFYVGLMKVLCTYEAQLRIDHQLGSDLKLTPLLGYCNSVSIVQVKAAPTFGGHIVTVEIEPTVALALEETVVLGLPKECTVSSSSSDSDSEEDYWSIKVRVTGKVLRQGQGTPLLKNGVKCLKLADNTDSDASEFAA